MGEGPFMMLSLDNSSSLLLYLYLGAFYTWGTR